MDEVGSKKDGKWILNIPIDSCTFTPSQSSQTGSDMKQKIETEVGGLWKWRQAKRHELLPAKCPIHISDHFKK